MYPVLVMLMYNHAHECTDKGVSLYIHIFISMCILLQHMHVSRVIVANVYYTITSTPERESAGISLM